MKIKKEEVILGLSVLMSLGWIYESASCDCAESAGRGGAIAVAASFAILFVTRSLTLKSFRAFSTTPDQLQVESDEKKEPKIKELLESITALKTAFNEAIDQSGKETKYQNKFLAAASIFGTLAWGFGDVIARHIGYITGNAVCIARPLCSW